MKKSILSPSEWEHFAVCLLCQTCYSRGRPLVAPARDNLPRLRDIIEYYGTIKHPVQTVEKDRVTSA